MPPATPERTPVRTPLRTPLRAPLRTPPRPAADLRPAPPHPRTPVRPVTGPSRRSPARALRAAALALALVAAGATPAAAHDRLVSTDPADGSTVDHAPTAVTLVFSEKVLDISATVVVAGPAGDVPATVAVDGTTVTATLTGSQPAGPYTVTWRVVSSDGHPVQGQFGYTVAAPEPTPTATPSPARTASDTATTSAPTTPEPSATPTPQTSTPPADTPDAPAGSSTTPLVVALAALAAVLGAGGLWARRRTARRNR